MKLFEMENSALFGAMQLCLKTLIGPLTCNCTEREITVTFLIQLQLKHFWPNPDFTMSTRMMQSMEEMRNNFAFKVRVLSDCDLYKLHVTMCFRFLNLNVHVQGQNGHQQSPVTPLGAQ